ncbi:MAG: hypothetical protein AB4042_02815 [Leptolyngbyaceae cyanobacterium]
MVVIVLGLAGCGGRSLDTMVPPPKISEVAPPQVIQALSTILADTTPQVDIVAPLPDVVLNQDEVAVQFQVEGMTIFQDETLGLGPHLDVLLDNQFYQSVYDLTEPLMMTDLSPGTHTLRAIATLPWQESFKTPSAQAQITFHVFAKTPAMTPEADLPVLTYHQPTGDYGAEPILLDYVLQPGIVRRSKAESNIVAIAPETATWQVRATVNGESFSFDLLEPIYLKGFEVGKNWVQLELLDEEGNPIDSLFNNTVRLINYQPGGEDTLSQLMRDVVTLDQVAGMIDPDYQDVTPESEAPSPDESLNTQVDEDTHEPENDLDQADSPSDEALAPEETETEAVQPDIPVEPGMENPDSVVLEESENSENSAMDGFEV